MSRKIDGELVKELYIKHLRMTKQGVGSQWALVEKDYEKATGQWFSRNSMKYHVKDVDIEKEFKRQQKTKENEEEDIAESENTGLTPKPELKQRVIDNMQALGVYREEFEDIINIYVNMLHRLKHLYLEFEESGYEVEAEYTNKAGATNYRKTPLYLAIEKLENDIVTYSDRLCLNPKSIQNIASDEGPTSKLDDVMTKLSERYS